MAAALVLPWQRTHGRLAGWYAAAHAHSFYVRHELDHWSLFINGRRVSQFEFDTDDGAKECASLALERTLTATARKIDGAASHAHSQ